MPCVGLPGNVCVKQFNLRSYGILLNCEFEGVFAFVTGGILTGNSGGVGSFLRNPLPSRIDKTMYRHLR